MCEWYRYRHYSTSRIAGLFLAPKKEVSFRFGRVVLELQVKVKYLRSLYETDINHNLREPNSKYEDIMRSEYPSSYNPFLSDDLSQPGEPQAVLIGRHNASIIKAVYTRNKKESPPKNL